MKLFQCWKITMHLTELTYCCNRGHPRIPDEHDLGELLPRNPRTPRDTRLLGRHLSLAEDYELVAALIFYKLVRVKLIASWGFG